MSFRIKKIRITNFQVKELIDESRRVLPNEACALLIGMIVKEMAVVERIRITDNISASPAAFTIDPNVLLEVYTQLETEGKEVVGIFHSHPTVESPSAIDIEYMKFNPIVWVILSTISGRYSAYQLIKSQVCSVEINLYG